MYTLDKQRGKDGSVIYRTDNFAYPLQKDRYGGYKIKSGELIRVCMTSDFFLEEADKWRDEAWDNMRQRSDVGCHILSSHQAAGTGGCLSASGLWQGMEEYLVQCNL